MPFEKPYETNYTDGDLFYGVANSESILFDSRIALINQLCGSHEKFTIADQLYPVKVDRMDYTTQQEEFYDTPTIEEQFDIAHHLYEVAYEDGQQQLTKLKPPEQLDNSKKREALLKLKNDNRPIVPVIRAKCLAALYWKHASNNHIHFNLASININKITNAETFYTGEELKWVYRNRSEESVKNHIQFWDYSNEVIFLIGLHAYLSDIKLSTDNFYEDFFSDKKKRYQEWHQQMVESLYEENAQESEYLAYSEDIKKAYEHLETNKETYSSQIDENKNTVQEVIESLIYEYENPWKEKGIDIYSQNLLPYQTDLVLAIKYADNISARLSTYYKYLKNPYLIVLKEMFKKISEYASVEERTIPENYYGTQKYFEDIAEYKEAIGQPIYEVLVNQKVGELLAKNSKKLFSTRPPPWKKTEKDWKKRYPEATFPNPVAPTSPRGKGSTQASEAAKSS